MAMTNYERQKRYLLRKKGPLLPKRRMTQVERNRKYYYGITPDDYNRMNEKQGGKCVICGVIPKRPLFIDHNHESGVVRGLVCHSCNLLIGVIERRKHVIGVVLKYINKYDKAV